MSDYLDSSDRHVTNGELYRLLVAQNKVLDKIDSAVEKQTDRIQRNEIEITRIKAYWTGASLLLALGGDWVKHKLGF